MAAALYPGPVNDTGASTHSPFNSRALMTDLAFQDNQYPSLAQSRTPRGNGLVLRDNKADRPGWQADDGTSAPVTEIPHLDEPTSGGTVSDGQGISEHRPTVEQSAQSQSQQSQSHDAPRSSVSYSLPAAFNRRVVERYSLDDPAQRSLSRASGETRQQTAMEPTVEPPRSKSPAALAVEPSHIPRSAPRHPSLPAAGIGAGPSSSSPTSIPSIIPLAASPTYNPPVSPRHRAYPQQPTFITQNPAPNAVNPVFSPAPPPQEEVCVECAMRDQDMADVDVASPGVWDRESDVLYEELKKREEEEEATGVINVDEPPRPRAKGGKLTEQNLKMWLSVNPREPASRHQTLHNYIKTQRTLLEAEALAHAQAMQEAKQLDNRMRDAYSQLRRSAYDMGSSAAPVDDSGGVRIKPPQSGSSPTHNLAHDRTHSREVTLLENGMIVEHVDVRKEEREARERKRKEERRARKSSRSSVIDATSLRSSQSLVPHTDSGVGLKPYSRYSQASSARPTSVLTAPLDRTDPRLYSQASLDALSLNSASQRRSHFFGIKNFKEGWRSQDSLAPSGFSGSMVDMHVALQKESYRPRIQSLIDPSIASRRSQLWPPTDTDLELVESRQSGDGKTKKKKKGLAKIWNLVKRSSKTETSGPPVDRMTESPDDDLPLAPPPPLSYLVDRGAGEPAGGSGRQSSTLSLSLASPKFGQSINSVSDADLAIEVRKSSDDDDCENKDTIGKSQLAGSTKNVRSVMSDPDMRQRFSIMQGPVLPNVTNLPECSASRPASVMLGRDKSLPPLPPEAVRQRPSPTLDNRPQTVYTFDSRQLPSGAARAYDFAPPQAPFRASEARRQSFNGLSSPPNLDGLAGAGQRSSSRGFGVNYDEFGNSRRSLHLSSFLPDRRPAPTKRKSRFGLSSLFGKKSARNSLRDNVAQQFPSMSQYGSDVQDETVNGYATSASRHSSLGGPRLSVAPRKPIEDLVSQDPDFVAYRYPSNDQRLDLLR